MAIGDIFRVTCEQALHGQTLLNVLYYEGEDEASGQAGLIDSFNDMVIPTWTPALSDQWLFVRLHVQKIQPTPLSFAATLAVAAAGQIVVPSLPTSVAVTITKQTAFAGRRYQGRIYIGGVPETSAIASLLVDPSLTLLGTLADRLRQQLVDGFGARYTPILLVRELPPPVLPVPIDIVNMRVNTVLRNQRRRQVGVGI